MFKKLLYNVLSVLGRAVQYGCVTYCMLEYIGDFVVCTGPSMEPTILNNNIIFSEHISARLSSFNRGDIIIAKCPFKPQQHICKRITGLPGDKVHDGFKTHVVPCGHVWLEGDNSSNSEDSREYGAVPQGLLRGRALFKLWPHFDMFP